MNLTRINWKSLFLSKYYRAYGRYASYEVIGVLVVIFYWLMNWLVELLLYIQGNK